MRIALMDFWDIDPLPMPPSGDPNTMQFWREHSAWVLSLRSL